MLPGYRSSGEKFVEHAQQYHSGVPGIRRDLGRPAQQIALYLNRIGQRFELVESFDALDHAAQFQIAGQVYDCADNAAARRVTGHAGRERPVYLHCAHRQRSEVSQAREARSEVVDGDSHTQRA